MSMFTETNEDAYSVAPETAATGPLVGFFDSFNAAVDAQMRTSSQYGIEYYMQDLDWKQTQALRDRGVADPPQLGAEMSGGDFVEAFNPFYSESRNYLDVARESTGRDVSPERRAQMEAYNTRIQELQRQYPDMHLRTSDQMFALVKKEAQEAEAREQEQRRSWGGAFGGFFGGALASLHPGTDPLNFYSAGIGGAGKSALQRILFQTGAQGAVETVNQITGVQEEREILGLSHGVADAMMRIGATAVGAGALQGVGEAAGYGLRRWFRNTPNDPAPPISAGEPDRPPLALPAPDRLQEEARTARIEQNPAAYVDYLAEQAPLSGIRTGTRRTIADIDEMTRALDDWTAGPVTSIKARTDNAAFYGTPQAPRVDVTAAIDNNRVYQAAKAADPEAFARFEKLTERRNTYRRWVDELAKGRDADVQSTMQAIDTRIHGLEAKLRTTQGKNAKAKVKQAIAEATTDRAKLLEISRVTETPDVAMVRKELVKADEQMRDLAPLIGRAYAKARGEWGNTTEELDAVWSAYRAGRSDVDMPASESTLSYDAALALADKAPVMRKAGTVPAGPTSADTARAVIEVEMKGMDEALEAYRQTIMQTLSDAGDGKLRIGDHEFDLDADRIFIADEDGTGGREVSVREMLEQNRDAEYQLEAISSCSMPRRS